MKTTTIIRRLHHLKPAFESMNIARMAVFGSRARGDERPSSDIDLLVDFIETPDFAEFCRTKKQLEDYLGRKVDLVTFRSLKTPRQQAILEDVVEI